jgi:hypothetical protein
MKIITIILFLIIGLSETSAQIESAKFYGGYSSPLSTRLSVNRIDAVGGGIEIRFKIYDLLSLSISGGYDLYSLQQDNALSQWNWRFWDQRYRGIVRADTAADPNLSAILEPVQKMDILPLTLSFNSTFEIFENLFAGPSIGAGVIFYTRRMYLHEYWEKRFSGADYTFEYNYRNFAQDKTGNPFFLSGGLNIDYKVTEYLSLNTGFSYIKMISTPGKYGYDEFPFEDAINVKLGLNFLY